MSDFLEPHCFIVTHYHPSKSARLCLHINMPIRNVLVVVLSTVGIVNARAIAEPQLSLGNANGRVIPGQCSGQSCQIASASGSTGEFATIVPVGSKLVISKLYRRSSKPNIHAPAVTKAGNVSRSTTQKGMSI